MILDRISFSALKLSKIEAWSQFNYLPLPCHNDMDKISHMCKQCFAKLPLRVGGNRFLVTFERLRFVTKLKLEKSTVTHVDDGKIYEGDFFVKMSCPLFFIMKLINGCFCFTNHYKTLRQGIKCAQQHMVFSGSFKTFPNIAEKIHPNCPVMSGTKACHVHRFYLKCIHCSLMWPALICHPLIWQYLE